MAILPRKTTACMALILCHFCFTTTICHMYARSNLTCMDIGHAIMVKEYLP